MTDATPQPALDRLVRRLSLLIGTATSALERDPSQVDDWRDEIARQITRYSTAAYLAGADARDVSPAARAAVQSDIKTQLKFLDQFAVEIQDAAEWKAGWNNRAEMYARSIQTPYWRGATHMLPLPAMPGDGTTACLTNCKCSWRVDELDGDNNYDAYWVYGATERHCQGCQQRATEWAPLQIRDGELL
jgi:hypothetical protein